jgi:hypothetical protein
MEKNNLFPEKTKTVYFVSTDGKAFKRPESLNDLKKKLAKMKDPRPFPEIFPKQKSL